MVHKLKKLGHSLQKIRRDSQSVELRLIQRNLEDTMSENRLPTDSILEHPIVGRQADVARIINILTCSFDEQVNVVPIIGGGGVGKTTVAKIVCEKVMERRFFDVKLWVYVSSEFNAQGILRQMLVQLNANMRGLSKTDMIFLQLKKELARKSFLLVLDDVWEEDSEKWEQLKNWLSKVCTKSGNAVIVTTCSRGVASIVQATSQNWHALGFLSNEECWSILKDSACRNIRTSMTLNFEAIGMELAKRCGGVPLVAKVLGGTMGYAICKGSRIRDFFNVEDVLLLNPCFDHLPSCIKPCFAFCSVFPRGFSIRKEELIPLWMAEGFTESYDEGNKYFDALLANSFFQDVERDYDGDVIQCKMHDFVHDLAMSLAKFEKLTDENCSISHETSRIYRLYSDDQFVTTSMEILKGRANKLCTMILNSAPYEESWKLKQLRTLYLNGAAMKELPPSIGKMEHLRYLDVSNSKIKELSESITKLYNLQTLILSNTSIKELPEFITELYNLQTLNLSNSDITELPESIFKLHKLQSLNISNSNIKDIPESISQLHNLQTLIVSNSNIKKLPESISELHNLQTLNVSNSKIIELPESITKLYNLQTLKFLGCMELVKLPRNKINNLISLKHITFSYEHQMPFGLGQLHGLETLSSFVVGADWGGSIQELEFLNELRGNLEITRLEEVGDKKEVERVDLQGKPKIQGLGFEWTNRINVRCPRDEELLEGLRPHTNIKRIKIKYYMGENWPSWMLRMKSPSDGDSFAVLNNLVDLRLEWCRNCVQLPRLGDLPCLKFLLISHLERLKCIGNEFYGIDREGSSNGCLRLFSALKSLSVSWMENLTEWSSASDGGKVVFPWLENLSIQSCSKLTGFPMIDMPELVKLEFKDCEDMRILINQQSFPSLASLCIVGCPKLSYLGNKILSRTCFRELNLRRCEWLIRISEDLGKLSYITSLDIYCCQRLRYFPDEILCKLPRLKKLSIGAFSEELDNFSYLNGIKDLPWLEELEIWGSDFLGRAMCFLPSQLQHLTVLKSLKIMGFTTMETLPEWLINLDSLQSLSLNYCKHLGWQSTVAVTRRLSSLTYLNINCCPILQESESKMVGIVVHLKIKLEFESQSRFRI